MPAMGIPKTLICEVCREIVNSHSIVANIATRGDKTFPQAMSMQNLRKRLILHSPVIYAYIEKDYGDISYLLTAMYNQQRYLDGWTFLLLDISNARKLSHSSFAFGNLHQYPDYTTFFLVFPTVLPTTLQFRLHYWRQMLQDSQQLIPYGLTESRTLIFSTDRRLQTLNEELYDLYESLLPKKDQIQAQTLLIRVLNKMVAHVWPGRGYKVKPIGSALSGLSLKGSDLDLCIVLPADQQRLSQYAEESRLHFHSGVSAPSVFNVNYLAEKLEEIGMVSVEAVNASVPICKFKDPHTQLRCDISVHNTLAIENSKLIKAYTCLDDRVRPLLYLIKYFTKHRLINDPVRGTLSSYAYTLICLVYLMKLRKPVIPNIQGEDIECRSALCASKLNDGKRRYLYRGKDKRYSTFYHRCVYTKPSSYQKRLESLNDGYYHTPDEREGITTHVTRWTSENQSDLATLLIDFFAWFGDFDYSRFVIGPLDNSKYKRRQYKSHRQQDYIFLRDPFIPNRNVAVTCTSVGLEVISDEFQRAYRMLQNGAYFSKICCPPDLSYRPYDKESIENRKLKIHHDNIVFVPFAQLYGINDIN